MGETTLPKRIPNLCQSLFSGLNILEFIIPKKRKISDIEIAHNLKSHWFFKGHKDITKKTIKKTIPKLLFDDLLGIDFFIYISSFTSYITQKIN